MEKYRPQPEQQHHSSEGGQCSRGVPGRQPEQTQPRQGRAEGRGSLQGPTTVDSAEQLQPRQESVLSRAVEQTRVLYERNGRIFLPLGEAGQGNVSRADTGDAGLTEVELKVKNPRKRRWRSSPVGGGRLHGYSYCKDKGPRTSEDKGS